MKVVCLKLAPTYRSASRWLGNVLWRSYLLRLQDLQVSKMTADPAFPCALYVHTGFRNPPSADLANFFRSISVPFPTNRLASSALQALQVDPELSPFVRRHFSLHEKNTLTKDSHNTENCASNQQKEHAEQSQKDFADNQKTVLRTEYKATTNRTLRVAVNGFMESLGVVLHVMEELDVDILAENLPAPKT